MEVYRLVTTRKGLIPINEIKEGTEVLSLGEWKVSPKPIKGTCLKCTFETLPTTIFSKEDANFKREVSICHIDILPKTKEYKPELSIRGYFKENKSSTTTLFKGLDSLTYWLPRFIKYYDEPMLPGITSIGFNLYHSKKKFDMLKDEDLTERNLEYVLEGMIRKTFSYTNGKYNLLPITSWNETHKLIMRLLDIECDVHKNGYTVVRNPVSLYKHIKDDYNKKRFKDEDIVYNLKRSITLPEYTSGHKILKKEECEDWILPGINPDINSINPLNCYETSFTKMSVINPEPYDTFYTSRWDCIIENRKKNNYFENNFYSQIMSDSNISNVDVESTQKPRQ